MIERYIKLDISSTYTEAGWNLSAIVKLDDEGVVVDIVNDGDEVLETTWQLYNELGVETIKFKEVS